MNDFAKAWTKVWFGVLIMIGITGILKAHFASVDVSDPAILNSILAILTLLGITCAIGLYYVFMDKTIKTKKKRKPQKNHCEP